MPNQYHEEFRWNNEIKDQLQPTESTDMFPLFFPEKRSTNTFPSCHPALPKALHNLPPQRQIQRLRSQLLAAEI